MSSLIAEINLPPFLVLYALMICGAGLYLAFSRPTSPQSGSTMMGISTLGHGLYYLVTAYTDIANNQFLYASVLVRIILAGVAALRLVLGGCAAGERKNLLIVVFYDGGMALILGWWLGSWNGRPPSLV